MEQAEGVDQEMQYRHKDTTSGNCSEMIGVNDDALCLSGTKEDKEDEEDKDNHRRWDVIPHVCYPACMLSNVDVIHHGCYPPWMLSIVNVMNDWLTVALRRKTKPIPNKIL